MSEVEDFHRREQALNVAMAISAIQNSDEKRQDDANSILQALSKPVEMVGGGKRESQRQSDLSLFDAFPVNISTSVVQR